jgi:predicted RNA polymerase sigma factor
VLSSGFERRIARALVTNEAVIQKRLYRARQFLKERNIALEIPAGNELTQRLESVYTILYLLFNEGYNSGKADELIRKDLCAEAMRLCLLLSTHKAGNRPATFALLSLMCFHASRFESRVSEQNDIILLPGQDRSKWDRELISRGYYYLNKSSEGEELTIYHLESAIAAEHCLAPEFASTNWQRLLQLYDMLLEIKHTPQVLLNRAIVVAQLHSIATAINEIKQIENIDQLLRTQYIFPAVLGDLYWRLGDHEQAKPLLEAALQLTTSQAEKKLIAEKLEKLTHTHLN